MYNIYSTIKFPCISLPDAGGDILFVSEDKRGPTVGAGLPSIASQLREIRTSQSEQSQRYLELLETQSLELQKLKASLFSLERTV